MPEFHTLPARPGLLPRTLEGWVHYGSAVACGLVIDGLISTSASTMKPGQDDVAIALIGSIIGGVEILEGRYRESSGAETELGIALLGKNACAEAKAARTAGAAGAAGSAVNPHEGAE